MRRLLLILILLLPLSAHSGETASTIELRARCLDGNPCRFIDEMIHVELELLNAGELPVSLPIEYYRRRGPKGILIDNHSGKESRLCMGPPSSTLAKQVQVLSPGEAVRIPWLVAPDSINRFAVKPVDLTVRFSFNLTPMLSAPDAVSVATTLQVVEGR